jgi:hypothetical protein
MRRRNTSFSPSSADSICIISSPTLLPFSLLVCLGVVLFPLQTSCLFLGLTGKILIANFSFKRRIQSRDRHLPPPPNRGKSYSQCVSKKYFTLHLFTYNKCVYTKLGVCPLHLRFVEFFCIILMTSQGSLYLSLYIQY